MKRNQCTQSWDGVKALKILDPATTAPLGMSVPLNLSFLTCANRDRASIPASLVSLCSKETACKCFYRLYSSLKTTGT